MFVSAAPPGIYDCSTTIHGSAENHSKPYSHRLSNRTLSIRKSGPPWPTADNGDDTTTTPTPTDSHHRNRNRLLYLGSKRERPGKPRLIELEDGEWIFRRIADGFDIIAILIEYGAPLDNRNMVLNTGVPGDPVIWFRREHTYNDEDSLIQILTTRIRDAVVTRQAYYLWEGSDDADEQLECRKSHHWCRRRKLEGSWFLEPSRLSQLVRPPLQRRIESIYYIGSPIASAC